MKRLLPILLCLFTLPASAARFAHVGSIGTSAAQVAVTNTNSFNTTATLEAGNLAVCAWGKDEATTGTGDGDNNQFASITDAAGNTWVEALEFCNMQTSAVADGACAAVYYTVATAQLNSGSAITITTNGLLNDYGITCEEFTIDGNPPGLGVRRAAATSSSARDNADPVNLAPATGITTEYLWVRACGAETNNSTWTADADYAAFTSAVYNSGTPATSMGGHADYRIAVEATATGDDPSLGATLDNASVIVGLYLFPTSRPIPLQ